MVLLQSVPRQHLVSEGGGGKGRGTKITAGRLSWREHFLTHGEASPRSSAAGMGSLLQGDGAGAGNPLAGRQRWGSR